MARKKINWELLSGLFATLTAVIALVFSIWTFEKQQEREEVRAKANVRPILSVGYNNFDNHKSIVLRNDGVGPAIISKVEFKRASRVTNNIKNLFNLPIQRWKLVAPLRANIALPANGKKMLMDQTLKHLESKNGMAEQEGRDVLVEWSKQAYEITIYIEYADVFGNPQTPLKVQVLH